LVVIDQLWQAVGRGMTDRQTDRQTYKQTGMTKGSLSARRDAKDDIILLVMQHIDSLAMC